MEESWLICLGRLDIPCLALRRIRANCRDSLCHTQEGSGDDCKVVHLEGWVSTRTKEEGQTRANEESKLGKECTKERSDIEHDFSVVLVEDVSLYRKWRKHRDHGSELH